MCPFYRHHLPGYRPWLAAFFPDHCLHLLRFYHFGQDGHLTHNSRNAANPIPRYSAPDSGQVGKQCVRRRAASCYFFALFNSWDAGQYSSIPPARNSLNGVSQDLKGYASGGKIGCADLRFTVLRVSAFCTSKFAGFCTQLSSTCFAPVLQGIKSR
jgi:hypothetical protein